MEMMTIYFRHEERNMTRLNKQLDVLSLAENESARRNEQLLKDLNVVSKHASAISEKTERLKKVRVSFMFHTMFHKHVFDLKDLRVVLQGWHSANSFDQPLCCANNGLS